MFSLPPGTVGCDASRLAPSACCAEQERDTLGQQRTSCGAAIRAAVWMGERTLLRGDHGREFSAFDRRECGWELHGRGGQRCGPHGSRQGGDGTRRHRQRRHQCLLFAAKNGSSYFVEGRGGGGGIPLRPFVSHTIVDGTGLIKCYVAFMEYPGKDELVDTTIAFENSEFQS